MIDLSKRIGRYEENSTTGEPVSAYIPNDLPPDPPIQFNQQLIDLLEEASQAIGRLDGATLLLPNVDLLIYMLLRKEALLSSQIEGTQSSFSDLIKYETEQTPGVPVYDVEEVSNYIAAVNYGLERMRGGFPLSVRLIKEIHEVLLKGTRGKDKNPGQFRESQNWIGGSRPGNALFVPPPPKYVIPCMSALEKFLHNDPVPSPPLIKAAFAHVQFETIHPFLDGNGRLGRLLITIILCHEKVLREPSLYLSLYLKTHRNEYYHLLQLVREKGNWEEWLVFFLKAVKDTSTQAVNTITSISTLFSDDAAKLSGKPPSVMEVYNFIRKQPVVSTKKVAEKLDFSIPTATKAINTLEELNILHEITGKDRSKLYSYTKYIEILSEGTEPL